MLTVESECGLQVPTSPCNTCICWVIELCLASLCIDIVLFSNLLVYQCKSCERQSLTILCFQDHRTGSRRPRLHQRCTPKRLYLVQRPSTVWYQHRISPNQRLSNPHHQRHNLVSSSTLFSDFVEVHKFCLMPMVMCELLLFFRILNTFIACGHADL